MPRQQIERFATGLRIPALFHFTRASNLGTIMRHGLYPVGRVHEIGVTPEINDTERLDGHLDGTSVSIGFPNSQMFYKYRMDNEETDWAVLMLPPSILWVKDCAFCKHNAADARISAQQLATLKTPQAFEGLYGELDTCATRADQCLKTYDPTDVQAEALVFDTIGPEFIAGVIFDSQAATRTYSGLLGGVRAFTVAKNKGAFAARNYIRKYT